MVYQPVTAEGTPLDSAIEEMDVIAGEYPAQARFVGAVKAGLEVIRAGHAQNKLSTEDACRGLFNLYWRNQAASQDLSPMAHILRVVGHDFGMHHDVEVGTLISLDQEVADRYA